MPRYLTVTEIAERLRKSTATVRRYIASGELIGIRAGEAGEWLVEDKVLAAYLGEPLPSDHGGAQIIAVANQKGGVGKTTTSVNIAMSLVKLGYKVLLVDLDPQGGCSVCLGVDSDALDETIYTVLRQSKFSITRIIRHLPYGLDFAPANMDLSGAEVELLNEYARESVLRSALRTVKDAYDFVVIDTQPTLGILTLNALTAAHHVLIPMSCEVMATRGLKRLFDIISRVQEKLNPDLFVLGIVATQYDRRRAAPKQVLDQLADFCKTRGHRLYEPPIPERARVQDAVAAKVPAVQMYPDLDASEAYMTIAKEIAAYARVETVQA